VAALLARKGYAAGVRRRQDVAPITAFSANVIDPRIELLDRHSLALQRLLDKALGLFAEFLLSICHVRPIFSSNSPPLRQPVARVTAFRNVHGVIGTES
jgi:hypothetical protein